MTTNGGSAWQKPLWKLGRPDAADRIAAIVRAAARGDQFVRAVEVAEAYAPIVRATCESTDNGGKNRGFWACIECNAWRRTPIRGLLVEGDTAMPRQKTYFIGIGGAGMSGLAHVMLDRGDAVAGSDLSESDTTARLAGKGARVYIGHDAAHIKREAPDVVVISSAVPADNPELQYAKSSVFPSFPALKC